MQADPNLLLSLVIPGKPRPKERPRVIYKKGRTWTYTPKPTLDYQILISNQIRFQANGVYDEGPLKLQLTIVHPRPKSRPRYIPAEEWKLKVRCWRPAKPDGDNVLKLVMDAITKSKIIRDDSQIVQVSWISLTAAVDESPFVRVVLRRLDWGATC